MVAKPPPTRLLIPAHRRPSRERLLAAEPFFLRDLAQVPVEAKPRLLAFETDAFMDDFLAAAGQTAPLPALRPWRDWAEPPDGLLDTAGQPRYPATVTRREPKPAEIEPASGPVMDGDGVPHGNALNSATTPAWLRKLYLPLHERFNLIAFDLVCGAAGWPRVARSRIKASGAIIRRLVARPDGEHWEDWIAVDDKHGAWVEVLDATLRPTPGAEPADPAALTSLSAAASVKLHALFGLAADAPLPAIALASQPLNLLPPNVGAAAEHCTLFGYLPVFSSAREVSAERLGAGTIDAIAARMAERTRSRLDTLFATAASLRSAARPDLQTLLDDTVLPARPTAAEITTADTVVAGLLAAPPFGLAHPADALAQGIDLAFLQALACLWTTATSAADADCDGNVLTAAQLWEQSGADTAASTSAVFDTLPDPSGLPGNQTATWLAASVVASPTSWDVLVRRRLFQLVDAWLAGSILPPPPQGASSLVGEHHLALLGVIALLRLRGARLALMASINRTLFGNDKRSELLAIGAGGKLEFGLAALGEQIDGVLAQESARDDPQATPPWPTLTFTALGADLTRVKRVHQAGQDLARVYAGFDAALAAAGTAAVAQRDAQAASVETAIAGAVGSPSLAAQGLDFLEQPACGLFVLPAFRFAQTPFGTLRDAAANSYTSHPEALALPEARAVDAQPRLRFDAEHLYAAWGWARVAGRTPCEPDRLVWTPRSEPFSIADPTDLLGARPASIQMPDIPRLLRDIPRIARARARPFAGIAAPPGSGVKVGDAMADTRRDFGLGMICNFGIPILTICALILFNLIFSILIKLPAFSWMLFLKFCLPFPKRGP